VVSTAAARLAALPLRTGAELLAGYDAHVDALPVAAGVRFERRRCARRFLNRYPDPRAWMHRSTQARLADMHRLRAWPFLSWCFVHRHLAPDLELLLAKPGGCGLPAEWAAQDADNVDAVAEAAAVLGWSKNWQRQVSLLTASTICLHTGKGVRQLSEDDFAGVLGQLDDLAAVSPSARHHARTRLFGLQQACYQLGSLSAPPRQSGPAAVGPAVHAAGVRQPVIRAEVLRYVTTIATRLRPYTVAGRTKALRVFFDYLADRPGASHRAVPGVGAATALARAQPRRQDRRSDRVPPGCGRPALLLRRHRRVGLGVGAAASAVVLRRHPTTARCVASGADSRRRPSVVGRRRRP
jgi:hypothetical protein